MEPFTLCYYSATASEIPSLSEGIRLYREQGGMIVAQARTQTQLFDRKRQEAFVREALGADILIISLHGGRASFPAFDLLRESLLNRPIEHLPLIHIQVSGSDEDSFEAAREFSTDFGTANWDTVKRYLQYGGAHNMEQLLVFLHNRIHEADQPCQPPVTLPDDGIYHPDFEGVPSLEDYLARKVDPAKVTVGLWFYQTYWINNDLAFVDALIRSIEAAGANVLPVFHLRYRDAERGNRAADDVVAHYFKVDGRPRIDVLINPLMFSLTLVAPDFKELLSGLGVPYIQAMTSLAPYAQWSESLQGMSTMDVSYAVAQPEFDGALITVPVATREQEAVDPLTGALLAKYAPIPERVDKVARLAINWGRLGRIPVEQRKIAIIFHHYPPRNDRIGCAAGLDSFASVGALLTRMREQG